MDPSIGDDAGRGTGGRVRLWMLGVAACAHPVEPWYARAVPVTSLDWDTSAGVELQQRGGVAYWVKPGPRALDVQDFGTPMAPRATAELPHEVGEAARDLIGLVPWLVGVPVRDRATTPDGMLFTSTRSDTPFGDATVPVRGDLSLVASDRRRRDNDRTPFETPDEATLTARFQDPEGARYEVVLRQVIQPPVPGWETDGGVLLGGWIGGSSGTDSPLQPRAWAYAAVWGLADVSVDGQIVARDRLVRVALTEPLRDEWNGLAQSWELPLPAEARSSPREHQTSLVVWPVQLTPDGPVYGPLPLPYLGPDDRPQSFLHVVFEGVRIVRGPGVEAS